MVLLAKTDCGHQTSSTEKGCRFNGLGPDRFCVAFVYR